jgi:hypothetical protein
MNDLIASNKRRTFFLLTGFIVITMLVGMAVGAVSYTHLTLATKLL